MDVDCNHKHQIEDLMKFACQARECDRLEVGIGYLPSTPYLIAHLYVDLINIPACCRSRA